MLKKVDRVIEHIEEYFVFSSLLLMVLIVFINVLGRFVFNFSISWSEEAARYLMIWATFIAASLGVKKGSHITLDILTVYLPEKANRIVRAISYILSMVYCILLLVIGIPFIMDMIAKGQISPALHMPIHFVYLAIVAGAVLMLIRYILLFIDDIVYSNKIEKTEIMAD
ncbi:TRAP transporter small permease [Bacillus infantis]|uniref:TRAP transporter small permease n=1 Tax=Bacillus infantis TaxID=324767 RepID=UPI0020045032|nr:TRAP transporter small permease [Bacillus infantis]